MRLPRVQFTQRSVLELAAVAAVVLVVNVNQEFHGGITDKRVVIPVACVVAAVYGVGAVRRPVRFLLPLIAVWIFTPQVDRPSPDVINVSVGSCGVAWLIGAPAGWISRCYARANRALPAAAEPSELG